MWHDLLKEITILTEDDTKINNPVVKTTLKAAYTYVKQKGLE